MKNLGIGLKLLFSIGGLAFGYLLFLGLVQWTSGTIQHHLRIAADSLFPAALAGQEAQAGFQKLTKDYKDAVVLQDTKTLGIADQDAQTVTSKLQIVLAKVAYNPELGHQVSALQDQFNSVYSRSKTTYTTMVAKPDAADPEAIKSLAEESTKLAQSLQDLNTTLSNKDLVAELGAIGDATQRQRLLTLLLFAVAVAFATFTTRLLRQQIAVPLELAAAALLQVANGDLTASLKVDSTDEVGQMAQALNDALTRLRATLQEVAETAATASSSSQSRRRAWSKLQPAWSRSPRPSGKVPTMPGRQASWRPVRASRRNKGRKWFRAPFRPWRKSTLLRQRSPTLSPPSTRSLSKPTCWL
jgi:HAMP domain-containing protein